MTKTLTLLSWNVNGARAVYKNGFMDWLAASNADIVCLQETRAESISYQSIYASQMATMPSGTHRAARKATAARLS